MKISIKASADSGPPASKSGIAQADSQGDGPIQQAGE
jgi:hypothetical protein